MTKIVTLTLEDFKTSKNSFGCDVIRYVAKRRNDEIRKHNERLKLWKERMQYERKFNDDEVLREMEDRGWIIKIKKAGLKRPNGKSVRVWSAIYCMVKFGKTQPMRESTKNEFFWSIQTEINQLVRESNGFLYVVGSQNVVIESDDMKRGMNKILEAFGVEIKRVNKIDFNLDKANGIRYPLKGDVEVLSDVCGRLWSITHKALKDG